MFDLAHKQCNGMIKGWLHCLTSKPKGRFLANNILLAWCLFMADIQFVFNQRIKIGPPERLLTSHHPTSNNISFLPYSPPPLPPQSRRHMCITSLCIYIIIGIICQRAVVSSPTTLCLDFLPFILETCIWESKQKHAWKFTMKFKAAE